MRNRLLTVLILCAVLAGSVIPVVISAQVTPGDSPVDYGPTIRTNTEKLFACYSLVRQMIEEYNRQSAIATEAPGKYADKFRHYVWTEFDPALVKLLREYSELKERILWGAYSLKDYNDIVGNATVEELSLLELSLYGDRAVEGAKDTVANYADLDSVKEVVLDDLEPTPGFDPVEDFTTYTEVDEGSDLTVDSNTVTFTGALTRGDTFYVYKDKGVDHFAGDWEHRIKENITDITSGANVAFWLVANMVGDTVDICDASEDAIYVRREWATGYGQVHRLWECDGGTAYLDTYEGGSKTAEYFASILRDDDAGSYGTVTGYVCTVNYYGESGSSLMCTLNLNLHSRLDYRYVSTCVSHDTGNSNSATGYFEDLDLQEGAPSQVGYSFGYIIGG